MIPVLYKFTFDAAWSQALLYLLAVGAVAYFGWSGWRGAHGPQNPKTGEFAPADRAQKIQRAAMFAAMGAGLAALGLHYALPSTAFLGSKGEGLPIHTYGVLLASGFFSAVSLAARMCQKEWRGEEGEHKREQLLDLAFWVLLGAILGSRILFVIVNWKDYQKDLSSIFSLSGGLVFYGGLIGASITAFIYARMHKIDFLRLADIAMPTVSLGQCLGRLGCFSAGCCWGDVTTEKVSWAVHFPGAGMAKNLFGQLSHQASLAFQSQSEDKRWVLESTGEIFHQMVPGAIRISEWVMKHGHTLPIHPTQLYESIGQLALFAGLMVLRSYRRFHGQILALWLMCYAVLRTTVELFRGDVERGTLNGLLNSLGATALAEKVPLEAWYNISTSQFISLCMFSLGAALMYLRGRQTFVTPASDAAAASA